MTTTTEEAILDIILKEDVSYVFKNPILSKIYEEGVKKFLPIAGKRLCLFEISEWVYRKLIQKKQHTNPALVILYHICNAVCEDFAAGVSHKWELENDTCPKNYRDIFFCVYDHGY